MAISAAGAGWSRWSSSTGSTARRPPLARRWVRHRDPHTHDPRPQRSGSRRRRRSVAPFVGHAAGAVADPRVTFRVGTADSTGCDDSLGRRRRRRTRPQLRAGSRRRAGGGAAGSSAGRIVAGYVWDYTAGHQLLRRFFDAAIALDPEVRAHDEGARFPITREGRLAAAFEAADLVDVDHRPIDVPTVFRDFDDLWTPFLRGTGPAPACVISLDDPARTKLRDTLRASLTEEPDGTIRLTARAWAVQGREQDDPGRYLHGVRGNGRTRPALVSLPSPATVPIRGSRRCVPRARGWNPRDRVRGTAGEGARIPQGRPVRPNPLPAERLAASAAVRVSGVNLGDPDPHDPLDEVGRDRRVGREPDRPLAGQEGSQLVTELGFHLVRGREEAVVRLVRVVRDEESARRSFGRQASRTRSSRWQRARLDGSSDAALPWAAPFLGKRRRDTRRRS